MSRKGRPAFVCTLCRGCLPGYSTLPTNPHSYDTHALHELLPSEFSLENFLTAASDPQNSNTGGTIYYTTVSKDRRVTVSSTVGLKSDFSHALKIILALMGRSMSPV